MPTTSRLVAAVCFALVALIAAVLVRAAMPPEARSAQFTLFCAGVGLVCGWRLAQPGAVGGYRVAAGSGVRTSVALTFWCLLALGLVLMVRKAFRMRYDGPTEAIVDVVRLALERARFVLEPAVFGTLLLGGLTGGLLAEAARRRWD